MNSDKTRIKTTIAFIFTTFPPEVSGSAQYNWERVQWLASQGNYRVVVFASDCQNTSALPSVPEDLKDDLILEFYPSKPWLPYNLHFVPTAAAERQISDKLDLYQPKMITLVDVERAFLFASWKFPGKRYAQEKNIPYITEYQTDYYNFAGNYPAGKWVREVFIRPVTTFMYKQFDTTIVPSQLINQNIKQMGVKNSHFVPFFGIDISLYSPNRKNRQCLDKWLTEKEKDNKILIFLGRLGFEKRVDLIIETFAELIKTHDDYSLIIAGDGPKAAVDKFKNLAKNIPNVHFTGFIHGDAKANLLASCDIFCNPSPYETFGRTVVEAMASGIPVVAVDSGAVSEYMMDGVNGYLVPLNDIKAFASAIEKVLSSDNEKIITQALQDANQLSSEQGCEKINKYYQEILY